MPSSAINKQFFRLLVSKNDLSGIRKYYISIKDEIMAKLQNLYNGILADQGTVDSIIASIEIDKSDSLTAMNEFVSNTTESLIVNHAKYKEMMERYQEYIENFYTRMTSLKSSYESAFINSEIGAISSSWKFHYNSKYEDARSVVHKFGPLNFTMDSDIFELTNNRYVYMTNENVVYDVDYKTKDVYVINIDPDTFSSVSGYGGSECSFLSLFKLKDRENVYAFLNVGLRDYESTYTYVGTEVTPKEGYLVKILKYDHINHEFVFVNASSFMISPSLVSEKINVIDSRFGSSTTSGSYAFYIDKLLVKFHVEGENTDTNILCTMSVKINSAIIYNNTTLLIPLSNTVFGVYTITSSTTYIDRNNPPKRFDMMNLSEYATGDSRTIRKFFISSKIAGNDRSGIYITTDKGLYFTDLSGSVITLTRDNRTDKLTADNWQLSFLNPDEYLIDEMGYIYILVNNSYLFCAKVDDNGTGTSEQIVQSPTRRADRLYNIENLVAETKAGYAYNVFDDTASYVDPTKTSNAMSGKDKISWAITDSGVYWAVTEKGDILHCDISTGKWNKENGGYAYGRMLETNELITANFYDIATQRLYFATNKNRLYGVDLSYIKTLSQKSVLTPLYSYDTSGYAKALLLVKGIIYIATNKGYVHAYDTQTKTFHTQYLLSRDYKEDDYKSYMISANCLGADVSINCLTEDGTNLIALGELGHVASCNFATKVWTNWDGSVTGTSEADAVIYDNGGATNNKNINAAINYNNTKLIVFCNESIVASCNLTTGNWTSYLGATISRGRVGSGPGIFNKGTSHDDPAKSILGGNDITAATRIGTVAYVAGRGGRMASIDLVTTGTTLYRGNLEDTTSIAGPGAYYQGEGVAANAEVTVFVNDTVSASVILSFNDGTVLSYSTETKEMLIPSSVKLYYVARRQTNYDYLSSLFVNVTKTTLTEKVPLVPPLEPDDIYNNAFQSSYFIYQYKNFIWRFPSSLDSTVYFSNDYGNKYSSISPENSSFFPQDSNTAVRLMPSGVVSNNGTLMFTVSIAGKMYFAIGKINDLKASVKVYKSNISGDQDKIDSLSVYGETFVWTDFVNGKLLALTPNDTLGTITEEEFTDSILASYYEDHIYAVKNSNLVKIYEGSEREDTICENIPGILSDYVQNVLKETDALESINDLYIVNGNNFNFVVFLSNMRIAIITVHFNDINAGTSEDNWSMSSKIIDITKYYKNKSYNKNSNNAEHDHVFTVIKNSVKAYTSNDGERGFIHFNLLNNSSLFITNSQYASMLINVKTENYGNTLSHKESVVSFDIEGSRVFDFERNSAKILLANYSEKNGIGAIVHTDSIHTYEDKETVDFTPVRGLTEAWRTIGFKTSKFNRVSIIENIKSEGDVTIEPVEKDYTLRYQILICNESTGGFILYETEKSTGMAKTDDETKVVEPLLRVIAIDRFDDEIYELYTSRQDRNRSSVNSKVSSFLTELNLKSNCDYTIKIKQINSLPENVDATFFLETSPTTSATTITCPSSANSIDLSEFKSIDLSRIKFGVHSGYIPSIGKDDVEFVSHQTNTNVKHYVQYTGIGFDYSKADTIVACVLGRGNGLFDKINGVVINTTFIPYSVNKKDIGYVFDNESSKSFTENDIKVSKNTRNLHSMRNFSVFPKGTINEADYELDYGANGRIVSVEGSLMSSKGLFEGISSLDGLQKRIGELSEVQISTHEYKNEFGAIDTIKERDFESAFDIIDRFSIFEEPYYRIKAWWSSAINAINKGNERLLALSGVDAGNNPYIAKKYLPLDKIDTNAIVEVKDYAKSAVKRSGNGVVSAINTGNYSAMDESNKTAYEATRTLIDEKFPLERWDGWEWADMCFIRKYRVTYVNDQIDILYEVEYPYKKQYPTSTGNKGKAFRTAGGFSATKDTTNIETQTYYSVPGTGKTPVETIDRALYYHNSTLDWEGVGTETFYYATGWRYQSHDWEVYKVEKITRTYNNTYASLVGNDKIKEAFFKDRNFNRNVSNESVQVFFYVSNTKDGTSKASVTSQKDWISMPIIENSSIPIQLKLLSDGDPDAYFTNYPIPDQIYGERVTSITAPVVEQVTIAEVVPPYTDLAVNVDKSLKTNLGSAKIRFFRRGMVSSYNKTVSVEDSSAPSIEGKLSFDTNAKMTAVDGLASDTIFDSGITKIKASVSSKAGVISGTGVPAITGYPCDTTDTDGRHWGISNRVGDIFVIQKSGINLVNNSYTADQNLIFNSVNYPIRKQNGDLGEKSNGLEIYSNTATATTVALKTTDTITAPSGTTVSTDPNSVKILNYCGGRSHKFLFANKITVTRKATNHSDISNSYVAYYTQSCINKFTEEVDGSKKPSRLSTDPKTPIFYSEYVASSTMNNEGSVTPTYVVDSRCLKVDTNRDKTNAGVLAVVGASTETEVSNNNLSSIVTGASAGTNEFRAAYKAGYRHLLNNNTISNETRKVYSRYTWLSLPATSGAIVEQESESENSGTKYVMTMVNNDISSLEHKVKFIPNFQFVDDNTVVRSYGNVSALQNGTIPYVEVALKDLGKYGITISSVMTSTIGTGTKTSDGKKYYEVTYSISLRGPCLAAPTTAETYNPSRFDIVKINTTVWLEYSATGDTIGNGVATYAVTNWAASDDGTNGTGSSSGTNRTITFRLTNITSSNTDTTVESGTQYITELTTTKTIPTAITVTSGSKTFTEGTDYVFDRTASKSVIINNSTSAAKSISEIISGYNTSSIAPDSSYSFTGWSLDGSTILNSSQLQDKTTAVNGSLKFGVAAEDSKLLYAIFTSNKKGILTLGPNVTIYGDIVVTAIAS